VIRDLLVIVLRLVQIVFAVLFPLAPTSCFGVVYAIEVALDRLRSEYVDPDSNLRAYYPASAPRW
jgi:hypothetical protein